jgi:hypothetical protein
MVEKQELLWNSFSSYFQLAAAFCLTYAFIETFTGSFNDAIYKIADYFIDDKNLSDNLKDRTKNYREHCSNRNSGIEQSPYDPLRAAIYLLIDRYKLLFVNSFLSCIFFLICGGFQFFYSDKIHVNEKFCGLIIIPFLSQLGLMFFLGLSSNRKIKAELSEWRGRIPDRDNYSLVFYVMLLFFLIGGLIIWRMNGDTSLFSPEATKIIVVICMFLAYLPFLTLGIFKNLLIRRYERQSELILAE